MCCRPASAEGHEPARRCLLAQKGRSVEKKPRLLRIGVLGAGPISQSAHFDACRKAGNAELYALCDAAPDLADRMAAIHQPRAVYHDYAAMLADPLVEAVIIGVADQFHIVLCQQAIAAGKHVLVEKPLGVAVEECEALRAALVGCGLVLQVGHNRRFDPGVAYAQRFVTRELGAMLSYKGWYYDSALRYTMTDNLLPLPVSSSRALRPAGNPKADRRRYLLLTHGSHLLDTARFLAGELLSVRARLLERGGAHCWFIEVEFANGSLGHLDLQIPLQGDFEEGFHLAGEGGSAKGRIHLPWFGKSGEVECFSARDRTYHRPLGEDAYTYKLQIEAFAATVLDGAPQVGANIDDGVASVRALVAIARSAESGERMLLSQASGAV
jgi:predicted dehydrogenase